jgi:hypothetical protein
MDDQNKKTEENVSVVQHLNDNLKRKKKPLLKRKRIPTIVYPQFICKMSNNLYLP